METRKVTLDPGESQPVMFTYVPQQAKLYEAVINGLSGSFEAVGVEEYHTIPLVAGWNNNIVYDGHTGDIIMLTSNIIGLLTIYRYEPGTGVEGWTVFKPEWVTTHPEWNTLTLLEYGKEYYIEVETAQDWEVPNP